MRIPLTKKLVALAIAGLVAQPSFAAGTSCFRGINISGAEFGQIGGRVDHDYVWPSTKTLDYFAGKGFNTVRLPFQWERLQPKLMGRLDEDELSHLMQTVELIRARGMKTILDPHNYARYNGQLVGSTAVPNAAFADFWARLARLYANDDQVVFGLINEPNTMPVAQWVEAANAAAAAIRQQAKANNLILVPGTAWTGAHSWMTPIDGEANGVALGNFRDPANNFAFEVHQYFDDDFSGTKGNCSRAGDAVQAVQAFTDWLKANGHRGMLGEFGIPTDPACLAGLRSMVEVVERNKDVWTGWTYWVAGDWWSPQEPLNIQPTGSGDRPQLQALLPALRDLSAEGSRCPALDDR
ncbi:MAG: glycoside hydrolase family 5 protein [Rhizobiaceae bacterium]|nr:glycoside hydrolase family 5 protein [Rhizobiaceae bacterium]